MFWVSPAPKARTFRQNHSQEQGYAMVSSLVLIPLILTIFVSLSAALFVLKRKSLAQSFCVQEVTRLQNELADLLTNLVKLNPKAKSLRRQREIANHAVQKALLTGVPAWIAAAKANQAAVIMAQLALQAQQQKLLLESQHARERSHRELEQRIRRLRASALHARAFYPLGLAVQPIPAGSISPDYMEAQPFGYLQQHHFQFMMALTFWNLPATSVQQRTECSASLIKKEKKWTVALMPTPAVVNAWPSF